MQKEFSNFKDEEQLKAENDFLKMKLMLERGGQFIANDNEELPADVENQFLNSILAFEKQFEEQKSIKVFDKIGRPQQFKLVNEIVDADMPEAWKELNDYMCEHGVNLNVCSPNVAARELYRFATEELFDFETKDMTLPGWSTNFIYDEFYPDVAYDNSQIVEQDLLRDIFRKDRLPDEFHYDQGGFMFNDRCYSDFNEYTDHISRFKSLFDEIELKKCTISSCDVKETDCLVTGEYMAIATAGVDAAAYSGLFEVQLNLKDEKFWFVKSISIQGFTL